MPAAMNLFRSRVDVFEAINRCEWQKVKDAVVPGKVSLKKMTIPRLLLLLLLVYHMIRQHSTAAVTHSSSTEKGRWPVSVYQIRIGPHAAIIETFRKITDNEENTEKRARSIFVVFR